MSEPYGQDAIDQLREDAGTLPVNRCQFLGPLQCVFQAGDADHYCLCHYKGRYWPHFTLKDYERQHRALPGVTE